MGHVLYHRALEGTITLKQEGISAEIGREV